VTWIRIETNMARDPKVIALAEGCGISVETAMGFLVQFWGSVAEHRPDGDLSGMSDDALERWAGWRGMPTVFADQLRKHFVVNDILTDWLERQGKLAARAAADRERKRRGNSTEEMRNDTVRSTPLTPHRPSGASNAPDHGQPPTGRRSRLEELQQEIAAGGPR